jgi:DNA-binding FadR family transcriptional regulator
MVRQRQVIPFRVPERRRLHEGVAEQLRDAILDGRFRAGEKLPPERELAEQFQVNRTSIREAIKVLEGLGLVTVRQGDGATVQRLVDASFDILAPMIFHGGRIDAGLLVDLNEVVLPLLLEMGRLAIERRRPENLRAMRALRDVAASAERPREARFGALGDLLVLLADMTGNRVWQVLGRRMRDLLASEPMRATRERLRRDPGRLVPMIDGALEAMDAGRTADAMIHLEALIRDIGDATVQLRPEGKPRPGVRPTKK